MKPTTPAMDTALARTDGQGYRWLLEITPSGGSTVYIAADDQTISGTTYAAELLKSGNLSSRLGSITDTQIEILDTAANRAAVQLSADAKLKLWAVGTALTDAMLMLWGEISDPLDIAAGRIAFDIVARAARQDQPVTRLLSPTVFPGADPDAVGRTLPVIYGSLASVPCLAIDAGSITTLQLNLTAAALTASLTDTAAFPASGTIQIDIEQINYTGKTATTLTGLTRGANGTTASEHDKGATVAEVQTQYDYLVADHPVKSIDAVYVDGVRQQGADFSVLINDAGRAKVRFTTWPTVVRQVNLVADSSSLNYTDISTLIDGIEISDTAGVTALQSIIDPGHFHDASSAGTTTAVPTTASVSSGSGSLPANIIDGNYATYASMGSVWNNSAWALAISHTISSQPGTPISMNVTIKAKAFPQNVWPNEFGLFWIAGKLINHFTFNNAVNNTITIDVNVSSYAQIATLAVTGNGSFYIYEISINSISWSNSASTLNVLSNTILSSSVTYQPGVVKGGAGITYTPGISKTGTVTLTGNSVADTKIGGIVTVDVQGWADDAAGSITGTPNALIERPDHIVRHMLRTFGGVTIAETGAADFDAFAGDVLSCYIDQVISVSELARRIAEHSAAVVHYSGDRWIMKKRPSPGATPAITLTDADIIMDDSGASTLHQGRSGLRSLINQYRWRAGLLPGRGSWANADTDNDAASQTNYGIRSRTISFPYLYTQAQAQTLIAWLLARTANPDRATIRATLDLRMVRLEIGDIAHINHSKTSAQATGDIIAINQPTSGREHGTINVTLEAL